MTRNWIGKPTGGPKVKRSVRTRASGTAPFATAVSTFVLQPFPRLDVLRDDDHLGIGFVRQRRIEPEPEPRRALADVGREGCGVVVAGKELFGFLRGRRCRRSNRAAFGHAELDEELVPLRGRKELLRYAGEARRRQSGTRRLSRRRPTPGAARTSRPPRAGGRYIGV